MAEIYTAEHITKTFGHGKHEVQAVKDVSFSLEEGQVTTIVGESGSGKSTIARMVLGLMPITSGKLTFQGKDVTNLKGRALRLQSVLHRGQASRAFHVDGRQEGGPGAP